MDLPDQEKINSSNKLRYSKIPQKLTNLQQEF